MSITRDFTACLQETFLHKRLQPLAAWIPEQTIVTTPCCTEIGATSLIECLELWFKNIPSLMLSIDHVIHCSQSIHFLCTLYALDANELPDPAVRSDCLFLLLFNDSMLSKESLSHIVFYNHLSLSTKALPSQEKLIKQIQALLFHQEMKRRLTRREIECLALYTGCKTLKEVARILKISPRTVETHIMHTMQKLNCFAKNQLFDYVNQSSCVPLLHQLHNQLNANAVLDKTKGKKEESLVS